MVSRRMAPSLFPGRLYDREVLSPTMELGWPHNTMEGGEMRGSLILRSWASPQDADSHRCGERPAGAPTEIDH
jgi:hypothetical protein